MPNPYDHDEPSERELEALERRPWMDDDLRDRYRGILRSIVTTNDVRRWARETRLMELVDA